MRNLRTMCAGIALAIAAAFMPIEDSMAGGAEVSVSAESTVGTSETTVTVTVSVSELAEGVKWRDLHFYPASGKKFSSLAGSGGKAASSASTTVASTAEGSSDAQTWTASASGQRVDVYSGSSSSGFGNGDFSFTLKFMNAEKQGLHPVTWEATKNGTKNHTASSVIDDNEGKPAPNFPQFTWGLSGPGSQPASIEVAIGTQYEMTLHCDAEAHGLEYEIYAAMSTGYGPCGIDVLYVSDPVSSALAAGFSQFSGTIVYDAVEGAASAHPRIQVPLDPALIGTEFYISCAQQDVTGETLGVTGAIKVTLVAP